MLNDNKAEIKSFFLYLLVGGIATAVEWVMFALLNGKLHIHYLAATVAAYIISTFCNWAAGRLLVFNKSRLGVIKEILGIYIASIGGLLLNLVIMFILVEAFTIPEMMSKVTATILVFIYNYLVRKKIIYKENDK